MPAWVRRQCASSGPRSDPGLTGALACKVNHLDGAVLQAQCVNQRLCAPSTNLVACSNRDRGGGASPCLGGMMVRALRVVAAGHAQLQIAQVPAMHDD